MTAWTAQRRETQISRQTAFDTAKNACATAVNVCAKHDERWTTQLPAARWANGPQGILLSFLHDLRCSSANAAILDEFEMEIRRVVDPLDLVRCFVPSIDVFATLADVEAQDQDRVLWVVEHNAENHRRHEAGLWRQDWPSRTTRVVAVAKIVLGSIHEWQHGNVCIDEGQRGYLIRGSLADPTGVVGVSTGGVIRETLARAWRAA